MKNLEFDKIYVLDTNVLIHDPNSIFNFQDNLIVIPMVVLEEVDTFKKGQTENGRNSRQFSRTLDELRLSGNLSEGVPLKNGGWLKIDLDTKKEHTPDNKIIETAVFEKSANPNKRVVLISKDINVRIKANALGVEAEDYDTDKVSFEDMYSGVQVQECEGNLIDSLYSNKIISIHELDFNVFPNQYIVFKNIHTKQKGVGRYDAKSHTIVPLKSGKDAVFGIKHKNLEQSIALDLLLNDDIKLVSLVGKAGTGKAQPLNAKILTPNGWSTMGDIKKGDMVIGVDGNSIKVVEVYPQGKKDIYEITFSDGSKTRSCKEHLWETTTSIERSNKSTGKVRELSEIMESLTYRDRKNHAIPMLKAVNHPEIDHKIDPYVLGCLIGDGSLSHGLSFSNKDEDILLNFSQNLIDGYELRRRGETCDYNLVSSSSIKGSPYIKFLRVNVNNSEDTKVYSKIREAEADGFDKSNIYRVCNKEKNSYRGYFWNYLDEGDITHSNNIYKDELIKLDLYGKKSYEKHVPENYKIDSIENRISLLQGLMDTDGYIGTRGSVSFCTTSEKLCRDFKELVWSLGGTLKCTERYPTFTYKGERKKGLLAYTVTLSLPNDIIPFRCERKKQRLSPRTKYTPTRYITDVNYVGEEEAQCIYVDDPRHLYITDDYVVTHNTLLAVASGLKKTLEEDKYKKLLVSRPIIPMGKDLGYLPGDINEKMNPWMKPIFDNLEYLIGGNDRSAAGKFQELIDNKFIEVEPITYIRGRSLPDQFMIIDESQNLTIHEMKTIISRAGEGTKIILTGDCQQIDNPYVDAESNGLARVVDSFKDQEIAGHITLLKGERSLLAEIASNIL